MRREVGDCLYLVMDNSRMTQAERQAFVESFSGMHMNGRTCMPVGSLELVRLEEDGRLYTRIPKPSWWGTSSAPPDTIPQQSEGLG